MFISIDHDPRMSTVDRIDLARWEDDGGERNRPFAPRLLSPQAAWSVAALRGLYEAVQLTHDADASGAPIARCRLIAKHAPPDPVRDLLREFDRRQANLDPKARDQAYGNVRDLGLCRLRLPIWKFREVAGRDTLA